MAEEALSLRRRRLDMALGHYPQGHPGGWLAFGLRLSCVCLAFVKCKSSLGSWSSHIIPTAEDKLPRQLVIPYHSNCRGQAPSAVGHPISFQLPRTSSLGSWSSHIIPTAEDKLPRQLVIPYHSNCRGQAPSAVGHPISFQLPRTSSLGSWSSHIIPTAEDKLPRQLVIPYHSNCRGQAPSAVGHQCVSRLPRALCGPCTPA
jgi:hypothetical protein